MLTVAYSPTETTEGPPMPTPTTTTLAQLLAIEETARGYARTVETRAHHTLQAADPITGLARTYQPLDDEGVSYPAESKKVQTTVRAQVDQLVEAVARSWDLGASRDATNTQASADVALPDGTVLV